MAYGGEFWRDGRLYSADCFNIRGLRVLSGAGEEELWNGTATARPKPGGIQLRFVSTDAADGVAGTGIRTLRLDFIDTSGNRQFELITMNGTTPVLSVSVLISSILSVTATVVGSVGSAVGAISIKDGAAAVEYDKIAIGHVATVAGVFVVPAGNKAFLTALLCSSSIAALVRVRSNVNPATGAVVTGAAFDWGSMYASAQAATPTPREAIGPFPAGARIWLSGLAAGATVAAVADGYLQVA